MNSSALDFAPLSSLSAAELELLQSTPLSGPFHHSAVLNLWSDVLHWQGQVIRCGRQLLVGFTRRSPLGRHFYSLPLGMYSHINSGISDQDATAISLWLRSQGFVEVRLVMADAPDRCPQWNLPFRSRSFHLIDLANPPDYSENTRRNLQKSATGNLAVRLLDSGAITPALRLLRDHQARTGERRKLPLAGYEYLLKCAMNPDTGIQSIGVFAAERLVAVQIYFVTSADAFYFDGFSLPEALHSRGNFLIMDSAIQAFRALGIKRLNLGASPAGDSGLTRFKAGWGASEMPCTEFYLNSARKKIVDLLRGLR